MVLLNMGRARRVWDANRKSTVKGALETRPAGGCWLEARVKLYDSSSAQRR